jgi:hypothetical protein
MRLGHGCVVALAFLGCNREPPAISTEVDTWARKVIALPVQEACTPGQTDGFFCAVRPTLFTPAVRQLGATITLQNLRDERYINIDWGGGHVEAHGVIIGPAGWTHRADPEFREHRIRDGVFSYDQRQ